MPCVWVSQFLVPQQQDVLRVVTWVTDDVDTLMVDLRGVLTSLLTLVVASDTLASTLLVVLL